MRGYTREAIKDKVKRIFEDREKRSRIVKMLKEKYGIDPARDVLKAYFIAVARTITFDMVACLENRAVTEEERGEIVKELLSEMDKILAQWKRELGEE
mgnify:CR=1 FL=1